MIRFNALLCAAVALSACSPANKPTSVASGGYPLPPLSKEGEVLAVIGPVTLTTAEMEKRIRAMSPFTRSQLDDPKRKLEYVKNAVQLEVLAQEAWSRGLQNNPEVIQQFKQILTQRLIQDEMKRLSKDVKVTDGEALEAYNTKKSDYVKPAKIRLAQIVRYVESDAERKAADKLLRKIRGEVLTQERKNNYRAFSNAAKDSSEDESTQNSGGDLQFLTRDDLTERYGKQVADHMFDQVKVGDLAVANAPNAVVLFKKTGARRGVSRTFQQVKPQLRGQLTQQKRTEAFNAFVEQLKKDQKVELHLSRSVNIKLEPTGVTKEPGPDK